MEDMQKICNALARTLKLTRQYSDIDFISYHKFNMSVSAAHVYWKGRGPQVINVSADSGSAMIRDILKAIR